MLEVKINSVVLGSLAICAQVQCLNCDSATNDYTCHIKDYKFILCALHNNQMSDILRYQINNTFIVYLFIGERAKVTQSNTRAL